MFPWLELLGLRNVVNIIQAVAHIYTQSKPRRSVSSQVGGNSGGQTTVTNRSGSREQEPSENTNKKVGVTGLVVYSSSTVFHHIRGR